MSGELPFEPLLIRPVNTLLVFRAAALAGTRPAWAQAAGRRAGASLPRINPAYIYRLG